MSTSATVVSVVTVTLNDAEGVKVTWESLAQQTHEAFEWIVVDGGSSDGTLEWLAALKDVRVSSRSGPDRGIYDAMNMGIQRCAGDLVVFMNGGDRFAHAETLSTVTDDYARRGWRWTYGAMRVVDDQGRLLNLQFPYPWDEGAFWSGAKSIGHQAAYFERSLLDEIGPYVLEFGVEADQELMARAALRSSPVPIPEVLADLLAGGVSSGGRPDAFVRAARFMRRRHGREIGGHRTTDLMATAVLSAEKWGRHLASRLVRRPQG
jgi:GT2 family glycosyltransferase